MDADVSAVAAYVWAIGHTVHRVHVKVTLAGSSAICSRRWRGIPTTVCANADPAKDTGR